MGAYYETRWQTIDNPKCIATNGTNIWVAAGGTMWKYDMAGNLAFMEEWALDGENTQPIGADYGCGGYIWVVDTVGKVFKHSQ